MKILVLSLSGIGDTLIATPFFRQLRHHYPEATIETLVLWAGSRDLLKGNPHLDKIYQKNLIEDPLPGSLQFLNRLRRQHYDVTINTHTQGRIHYRAVARFIGAKTRLSHAYEKHGWLDRRLVNRSLPQDYSVHSVTNNNRLLTLLDREPADLSEEYEVVLTQTDQDWARHYLKRAGLNERRMLGVHVGSGGTKNLALKRWPLDHYIALFKRMVQEQPDWTILLLGGPAEREAHARIAREVPGDQVVIPETRNIHQAAILMRSCQGFLSVDTALMHLAAAMKVPGQVVIEAPTLNATNVPWQNPYHVVRNPVVDGHNLDYYRYDGNPLNGTTEELLACMASIRPDAVYQALGQKVFQPQG